MTDESKVEYAKYDEGHVAALLHIVEKAAGHTPKLNAIASEAMLELEAINADVQKFRDDRAAAKAKADAEVQAAALEKARKEAEDEAVKAEKAKADAAKQAEIDAAAASKVKASPADAKQPDPVTGFNQ